MQKVKIFLGVDNARSEIECLEAESRPDIYVVIEDEVYYIHACSLLRFSQDYDDDMAARGFFRMDPYTFLVKEASKSEIIRTINHLAENGYFRRITPWRNADLSGWVRVQ